MQKRKEWNKHHSILLLSITYNNSSYNYRIAPTVIYYSICNCGTVKNVYFTSSGSVVVIVVVVVYEVLF
jgi:hypothetical protein